MTAPEYSRELIDLASKYHEDLLSAAELARLNDLLRDEKLRDEFIDYAQLHHDLARRHDYAACQLVGSIEQVHAAILHSNAAGCGDVTRVRPPQRWWYWAAASLATAATLALAAWWGGFAVPSGSQSPLAQRSTLPITRELPAHAPSAPQPPRTIVNHVARVVQAADDFDWGPSGGPRDFLLRLTAGELLEVRQGLVKIEFGGGATVILAGPGKMQVIDQRTARLMSGAVTGRSEQGNFTLLTPQAEVIDIGTEFGVNVGTDASTRISVFDGIVHVKPQSRDYNNPEVLKLAKGMSAVVDPQGQARRDHPQPSAPFARQIQLARPQSLGSGEVSLIDVICGGHIEEHRWAGAIDPQTGHWSQGPWAEPRGVARLDAPRGFTAVVDNPFVVGVFVPTAGVSQTTAIDNHGTTIVVPQSNGVAWGPVWARRKIDPRIDPLVSVRDRDTQGFWGAGSVTALLDRAQDAGDGLVGMHANIGITIDLEAIRTSQHVPVRRFRACLAHLEKSRASQPFAPESLADFRVYVDGQLQFQRERFRREEGDEQFSVELSDRDRLLTLLVTDGGDGATFDRVILIDPVLETPLTQP